MNPQIGTAECVVCREAITNPVCPDCLNTEARTWLSEKYPDLIGFVDSPMAVTGAFMHTSSKCVICGKDMAVCAHCYTRDIFQQLAQESPTAAANFARVFNWEFAQL